MTVATELTAELKRRTVGGGIADWTLTPDVDSPNGLSDPMADYGARERIEAVKTSVDQAVAALQSLTVGGEVTVTGGATENTLAAVLGELEGISAALAAGLSVTGSVSVTNHPAEQALPPAQVTDLKKVQVTNQPATYPLPDYQHETTLTRIDRVIAALAEVEAEVTLLRDTGFSINMEGTTVEFTGEDFPDSGGHLRLDEVKARLDTLTTAINGLLKPGGAVEVSNFPIDPELGTWGYMSGTTGTGIVIPGRVLAISMVATSAGAYLRINGGSQTPMLANFPFTLTPKGNLVEPTVDIVGTDTYFIEYVT